ncbi:hypothetical protein TQ38_018730 [Novosphingobium sp. P6W]|nr:hypothetical protein TQ38_018730 [Novosphingobium sp. P6W]
MTIGRWFQGLISRNCESGGAGGKPTGRITPERLEAIFAYARGTTVESIGALHHAPRHLKFNLHFHPDPFEIDMRRAALPYRRDEIIAHPAHLDFSYMPRFAKISLVDGYVEYRWSETGQARYYDCAVTHDPAQIALIDDAFDLWEANLEERRIADAARPVHAGPVDRTAPMALIRHYIAHADPHYLFDVLGGPDTDDIVLWVDRGEEDDEIVKKCAALLSLPSLSARFDDMALEITRGGVLTRIDYDGGDADRDETLAALAGVLRPDFELRYCTDSQGNSDAAFLPLPRADWEMLEREYPAEVARLFTPVSATLKIFR